MSARPSLPDMSRMVDDAPTNAYEGANAPAGEPDRERAGPYVLEVLTTPQSRKARLETYEAKQRELVVAMNTLVEETKFVWDTARLDPNLYRDPTRPPTAMKAGREIEEQAEEAYRAMYNAQRQAASLLLKIQRKQELLGLPMYAPGAFQNSNQWRQQFVRQ